MRKAIGSGWYNESRRHALAAQGIESGRKINPAIAEFEAMRDNAKLRALSKVSLERPLDDKEYKEMMELGEKFKEQHRNPNLPKWEGNLPEQTLNLIKRRLNEGKLKYDDIPFPDDASGIPLAPEQVEKGREWQMGLWKTPTGAERKNSPFGGREQAILEKFDTINLHGFYDTSRYGGAPYYVPIYEVEGDNTSFEYYLAGAQISIIG